MRLQLAGLAGDLALAVPLCLEWPGLAGAAVAAPIAVVARGLPFGLGLFAGIVAGICAAVAVDAAIGRNKQTVQREGDELVGQRFKLSPRVEANPRLLGAVAATLVILWKRSMVACIFAGMLVVTAFRFV
ncbi:MAG TPA: AzlD domain-containing protein [Steroidobacteraceae bacterium]|nr:AzlD domain-containing protein [Steroidobacteraceae bacterium]